MPLTALACAAEQRLFYGISGREGGWGDGAVPINSDDLMNRESESPPS